LAITWPLTPLSKLSAVRWKHYIDPHSRVSATHGYHARNLLNHDQRRVESSVIKQQRSFVQHGRLDECLVESVTCTIRVRWIVAWIVLGTIVLQEINAARQMSAMTANDWPILMYYGVIVLWIWRQWHCKRLSLPGLLGQPSRVARQLISLLAGPFFALMSLSAQFLIALVVRDLLPQMSSSIREDAPALLPWTNVAGMAFAIVMLVIVGPVIEEILYRGILLNHWKSRLGVRVAVALSTILFALVHEQVLWAICFGLLLSFVYLRTGSLWITIGVHSLNNTVALIWMVVAYKAGAVYQPTLQTRVPLAIASTILGLVGVVFILSLLLRNAPRLTSRPVT